MKADDAKWHKMAAAIAIIIADKKTDHVDSTESTHDANAAKGLANTPQLAHGDHHLVFHTDGLLASQLCFLK